MNEYVELARIVLLSGLFVGVVIALPFLRLSMFALRLTSPDSVIGVQSDDDFTIGEFTLSGTYNLGVVGASVGVLGAAVYVLVSPWLIGSRWLRAFTFAFTAGVFVGAQIITDVGVDFRVLKPTWFAIALFVAVPLAVGAVIPWVVDKVATRGPSRNSWIVIVVLQAAFFLSAPISLVICVVLGAGLLARRAALELIQRSIAAMWAIRAAFMIVPVSGTLGLVGDLQDLL